MTHEHHAWLDRTTAAIDRASVVLWGLLIASLALAAFVGIDPPAMSARSGVGAGYVWLDLLACCALWTAGAAILTVRAASTRGWSLLALGDYLQLGALTVTAMRMTVALALQGDAYISLGGVIALVLFAASSVSYSMGRLMRVEAAT